MQNAVRNSILTLLLIAAGAALWTDAVLYSQNSLFQKREWVVPTLKQPLMLGMIVLKSRMFVAGNQLHLGAWWKNDELVTRQTSKPSGLSVDFQLVPHAIMDVIFNYDGHQFSAVRLSTDARQLTMYRAETTGEFLSRSSLSIERNLSRGAHKMKIAEAEGGLDLQVDDLKPIHLNGMDLSEGAVGFRVANGQTTINSIDVRYGDRWTRLGFANRADWAKAFLRIFGVLLVLGGGVFIYYGGTRRALNAVRTLAAFVASLAAIWYAFDYFYWSWKPEPALLAQMARPPVSRQERVFASIQSEILERLARLAGAETRTFDWRPRLTKQQAYNYVAYDNDFVWCGSGDSCIGKQVFPHKVRHDIHDFINRPKLGPRMVFLGGSQLFGSGARTIDETAFARIHRFLKHALGNPKLESINYSIVPSEFLPVLQFYRDTLTRFEPDLVVVSRTELEYLRPDTESAFRKFIEFNRGHGIETIILNRSINMNCLKFTPPCSLPDASAMDYLQGIAAEYGLKILDPNEWLSRREALDNGNLWADEWHLTSYGQSLLAQWLGPQLLVEFKNLRVGQKRK